MPRVALGPVELEYDTLGDRDAPAILLIMGFSMQMTAWPESFRQRLADAGFRVIRFDNRDIGLSSRLNRLGFPSVPRAIVRRSLGLPVNPPYRLVDMAVDAVALLNHLGVDRAHVVGASMGGMIAQWLAIEFPDRVVSLCSIMSTTGQLRYGWPRPRVLRLLLHRPGPALGDRVRHGIAFWQAVGSPGDMPTEPELRAEITAFYERSSDLSGFDRQLCAILAERSRVPRLGELRIPALVIHGDADPLIRPAAGRATARAIPGARFEQLQGMGHDLRPAYLGPLSDHIIGHARG